MAGSAELELRAARTEDVAAIASLVRAAEAHDRVPRVLADEELAEDFEAAHVDLADDTRVAVRDGEIVGWALVWKPPAEHRVDRAELDGEVAPDHRGSGIGRALLGWSVDRARRRFAARADDLPCVIRVSAYDWLDDRVRLYSRIGFSAVRWHEEMLRPLVDLPSADAPDGISVQPWSADRDEELRAVRNSTFGDHWGSTVIEPEQWRTMMSGHAARPDLSVIAIDDDTDAVIGICMNQSYPEDEAATGRRDAWIANVGTLASARGRGVASAMIARSLSLFAEAGFSHAALGVDAASPTGAGRLYRGLGFEPHLRSITFEMQAGS